MRQYDFPDAVQTEIYGLSDATGALTVSYIDASGVCRGFSGDTIVEVPGASATYADFVSWTGHIVGSYVDAKGIYHAYMRSSVGRFLSIDLPNATNLEYFFLHGLNNARVVVGRAKAVGDVPRTYVGSPLNLKELKFPGSVSTEGWNINQDGSVVEHYDSADGRRHGFIAIPAAKEESDHFGNSYNLTLTKGLNILSLPLASPKPMTAKSLAGIAGATVVIDLMPQINGSSVGHRAHLTMDSPLKVDKAISLMSHRRAILPSWDHGGQIKRRMQQHLPYPRHRKRGRLL